mgnify:CR=1 FL=1
MTASDLFMALVFLVVGAILGGFIARGPLGLAALLTEARAIRALLEELVKRPQ